MSDALQLSARRIVHRRLSRLTFDQITMVHRLLDQMAIGQKTERQFNDFLNGDNPFAEQKGFSRPAQWLLECPKVQMSTTFRLLLARERQTSFTSRRSTDIHSFDLPIGTCCSSIHVRQELGDEVGIRTYSAVTFVQFVSLLEAQLEGQPGHFLTDGSPNSFFVVDDAEVVFQVYFDWRSRNQVWDIAACTCSPVLNGALTRVCRIFYNKKGCSFG